ncbi:sigma 54-interacting transcriptional regulator [Niallia sp. 03133]|uniref:sigma 54-interacting transcriptional regulator n=1 Tax=Niallia sp. 03133 TaxID=3458060 RepID=UPI004043AAF2
MQFSVQIQDILNEMNQGIIVIDKNSAIVFFNEEAADLVGFAESEAVGKHIMEVVPTSGLPRVIRTGKKETEKLFDLESNRKVRISRLPLFNKKKQILGAIALFSSVSDYNEEWFEKETMQALVEMLVQNIDAAISIIDEKGKSMMKNSAYENWADSMEEGVNEQLKVLHHKVLQTRRAHQYIKNNNQLSIKMNAFPVMINGKLKGSFQTVHDYTQLEKLQKELKGARSFIRALEEKYIFDDIIGRSPSMQIPLQQCRLASNNDYPVFIRGAAGTGKKMFARAIHNESNRKYNRFFVISCLDTSEKELEEILIGMVKGNDRKVAQAVYQKEWQGTVYLDEISCLPLALQYKLLSFLQCMDKKEKSFRNNVRIIVGSSENIEKALINGDFLEELYYKLNKISIHLPLLEERQEDIPQLTKKFVQLFNHDNARNVSVAQEVIEKLKLYSYSENVKELKAILQLSLVKLQKKEKVLGINHLCFIEKISTDNKELLPKKEDISEDKPLSLLVEEYEKIIIGKALTKNDGNKTLTAKLLGLSVRNLYYKLEKYGLG